MRISQLSPLLANQIAAGEVIERPASVVKELLENALDAKAKRITIDIEGGGSRLIRVRDDGIGIHPDDFHLAIKSHATSKIVGIDDLFAINTLGFRGEALASIAAISRFCITSRAAGLNIAQQLSVVGDDKSAPLTLAAHPQGTTIEVRDLFFNTPVRRKFLRSDKTEFSHIDNLVRRLMMSHFDVAFTLNKAGKSVLDLPSASDPQSRLRRISKIFGVAFETQSIFIDECCDGLRLWGWLGDAKFQRSQNDLQYSYVNGRMIRDRLINHALRQAYEDILYPGRHSAYLLYLELPPQSLDVNVHPTKHEVRFNDSRQVHDFILSRVKAALNEENVPAFTSCPAMEHSPQKSDSTQRSDSMEGHTNSAVKSQSVLFGGKFEPSPRQQVSTVATKIIELGGGYSLVNHVNGWVLCHHKALFQWLLTERLYEAHANGSVSSRPLLLPVKIRLTESQITQIQPYFKTLEDLGLLLEPIDSEQFVIREFPVMTPQLNFKRLIDKLLQQSAKSALSSSDIIALISECDIGDCHEMSDEDRLTIEQHIEQFLAQEQQGFTYFKRLTDLDWEQLLHA